MCQSKAEGSRRCPTHASGSQALSYEAEREYGIPERIFRKALSIFRKEAYHNGISDKINAKTQDVKAFIAERLEAVKNSINMSDAEKRTAIRRWTRAAKEKISMATLYSWKKASALMAAGSMAVLLTACSGTGEDTKNLPEGDSTPVASSTADPTSDHTQPSMDEKGDAFGYDFSAIDIPEDIQERYGKEASANIVNDAMVPLEVIRSNQGLYDGTEKNINTYLPLKPYLTPYAWDLEQQDYENEVEDGNHTLKAYALKCSVQEDGTAAAWYVKEGREATKNDDDYELMTCDVQQNVAKNVTINKMLVESMPKEDRPEGAQVTDVPEHIIVHFTVTQAVTGKNADGEAVSQEYVQNNRAYMIPDPEKENHWLVDAADWSLDYGETSYS